MLDLVVHMYILYYKAPTKKMFCIICSATMDYGKKNRDGERCYPE
jgi:hypothetical protein